MPVELRPLSAGELLDTSISMVRTHYTSFLAVVVPLYLAGYATSELVRFYNVAGAWRTVAILFQSILAITVETRLACGARDLLEGRVFGETRTGPIFRRRWAAIFLGYGIKWILVVVGVLLLILPGAYLLTLYFGVPYISAFENVGIRGARERSRALARPNLGRVFVTIGLFDLAVAAVVLGVLFLATGGTMRNSPAWSNLFTWLFSTFTIMVRGALNASVYLDCRIRSEGYDLDLNQIPSMPLPEPS